VKVSKDYINLLPRVERARIQLDVGWVLPVALFLFAWLLLFGLQWKQQARLHGQLAQLAQKKQGIQGDLLALQKELGIDSPMDVSREKKALVTSLLKERVVWSEVFRQFSRIVPKGMWFDSVEGTATDRAEIKIRGGSMNYLSISDFMLSMEKTGYFKTPQLVYAQKTVINGQDVVGFEIIAAVTKGQGAR